MNIGFLGTNYQETPISEMEKAFFNKEGAQSFLNEMPSDGPIHKLMMLMTCNRVEWYFTAESISEATPWLYQQISRRKEQPLQQVKEMITPLQGDDVLRHLFSVSSGIESMVFGENEILAQVKQCYDSAQNLGQTDPILNKVFQVAISTGKRVRSETSISRGAYSVSSIAIEAIRETVLDYFGRKILVVGAGTMGSRALKKLVALGHPDLTIANRTNERARELAEALSIEYLAYEKLKDKVSNYDIVICATSSKQTILDTRLFSFPTMKTLLLIDLGVPHNINPSIHTDRGIQIISVGGLKKIADKNINRRRHELDKVKEIIKEEIQKVLEWHHYREKQCIKEYA